jgi:hypothetical protein
MEEEQGVQHQYAADYGKKLHFAAPVHTFGLFQAVSPQFIEQGSFLLPHAQTCQRIDRKQGWVGGSATTNTMRGGKE